MQLYIATMDAVRLTSQSPMPSMFLTLASVPLPNLVAELGFFYLAACDDIEDVQSMMQAMEQLTVGEL